MTNPEDVADRVGPIRELTPHERHHAGLTASDHALRGGWTDDLRANEDCGQNRGHLGACQ